MGLSRRLWELRDKQVISQAEPYLNEQEEVVQWARAQRPDGRHGFVFLTAEKLVVHWTGRAGDRVVIPLHEVESWGINETTQGGPMLGVETGETAVFFVMRVSSPPMVERVKAFVHRFARLAPKPRRSLKASDQSGPFSARADVEVTPSKKSVAGYTKGIVVTIIGLALLLFGLAIVPLPGPWSLPLLIGGLAVLASEYDWAEDILTWAKEKSRKMSERVKARRSRD